MILAVHLTNPLRVATTYGGTRVRLAARAHAAFGVLGGAWLLGGGDQSGGREEERRAQREGEAHCFAEPEDFGERRRERASDEPREL